MDIHSILEQMGLSKKHAETFVLLYTYGSLRASSLGKMLSEERTNMYKILQTLVKE